MPTPTSSDAMSMRPSPAQLWTLGMPSPPRIIVPPPPLDANGMPDLHVVQDPSFDAFERSGFVNSEFLQTVTYGNFMTANNMLEWKYEQRRMAQRILPFLYLGPMSAARDKAFLQREGITLVMAVRNTMSAQAKMLHTKAAQELGLDTRMIDVAGNQELIAAFPKAIEFINVHLSTVYEREQVRLAQDTVTGQNHGQPTLGKVLIFCETGNERSATLVTAYIMAMYSMELVKAIQIVQAQRFAVAFDDSLRNLLSTYEMMLQAKRDILQANLGNMTQRGVGTQNMGVGDGDRVAFPSKRTFDAANDDDMEMGDEVHLDAGRFEGRAGSAPFQDPS